MAAALLIAGAPAAHAGNLFVELADFASIARPRTRTIRQFSSADPAGGNRDWSNFLRTEGSAHVLAESAVPGAIVRLQFSGGDAILTAPLRIYLDGALALDTTPDELTGGALATFPRPLADRWSGCYFSLVPIHYRQSCKVTIETSADLYYEIQVCDLPLTDELRTFTGALDAADQALLDAAVAQWSNPGVDPKPAPAASASGTIAVPAGGQAGFFWATGPGMIGELRLRLAAETASARDLALRQTRLQMWVDGRQTIDCPVGAFFGMGLGATGYRSLAFGAVDGDPDAAAGGYCYLPMPYGVETVLALASDGDAVSADWRIGYSPLPSIDGLGVLNAVWNHAAPASDPYVVLNVEGCQGGRYVGTHLCVEATAPADFWFFEGDDRAYVDGASAPAIPGTGMEDYFNGGYYFVEGTYTGPVSGCSVRREPGAPSPAAAVALYRHKLLDSIPFVTALRLTFEAYDPQDFSSVAFWYDFAPGPLAPLALDSQTFVAGTNGWSYGAINGWGLSAAVGETLNGSLAIRTTNNTNNFGYWNSALAGWPYARGDLFRAGFTVHSNLTDSKLCPTIRLRTTTNGGQQSDQLQINSVGANVAPSFGGKLYELFFAPGLDPAAPAPPECEIETAMDVISFSPADAASAIVRLSALQLDRIRPSALGAPANSQTLSFADGALRAAWSFLNSAPVFAAPQSGIDATGAWLTGQGEGSCYGSWGLAYPALTLPADSRLLRVAFRVAGDEPEAQRAPGMRLRLNTSSSEMVRALSLASVGAASLAPSATARPYELYFRSPLALSNRAYTLSFDLTNFAPDDSTTATLKLESCQTAQYDISAWP